MDGAGELLAVALAVEALAHVLGLDICGDGIPAEIARDHEGTHSYLLNRNMYQQGWTGYTG